MLQFYIKYRIRTDNRAYFVKVWSGGGGAYGAPITLTKWLYQYEEIETLEGKKEVFNRFVEKFNRNLSNNQSIDAMIVNYPPYEWLLAESERLQIESEKISQRSLFFKQQALKARLSQDVTAEPLELD